ncbi:Uma2 family endonuclease [Actinocorallia sp. B10E7]|uniref:Uma2 family endonuclease n=1 Tax=Actinocorallia sp. B10E7 TaxID=3153558 RepID=UPI00325C8DE0
MDAELAEQPFDEDESLLQYFLALETPEGFRAELVEGEIVVSPPPGGYHEHALSRIVRQMVKEAAVLMDFSGNRGVRLRRDGLRPKNHVIPDAVFAPAEMALFASDESWMEPEGVAMVVEVTSSNPDRDRTVKRRCYARAGIPLYLLVDQSARTVTLFNDPDVKNNDYRTSVREDYGTAIELPEPFGFKLETSGFC